MNFLMDKNFPKTAFAYLENHGYADNIDRFKF
jgi:hypothetical protein